MQQRWHGLCNTPGNNPIKQLHRVYRVDQVIPQESDKPDPAQAGELTLLQVMGSVFAAGFGVQSRENKVRDFTRGKPVHFIAAGVIFTVVLLVALIAAVNLIV